MNKFIITTMLLLLHSIHGQTVLYDPRSGTVLDLTEEERDPNTFPTMSPTNFPTGTPTINPTKSPSETPTAFPTDTPTTPPTKIPTTTPSISPTGSPTNTPSELPSLSPTISSKPSFTPSDAPTDSSTNPPTLEPTRENEIRGNWWNYDPNSRFGPDQWHRTAGGGDPIFKQITGSNSNRCDSGERQSPINLHGNIACGDDHQIQTKRGNYDFDQTDFKVLPYALRVLFKQGSESPQADTSNLSEWVNAVYMDLKIPSEHYMEGRQYDGEIVIGHDYGSRMIAVAWMLDTSEDMHNDQLEEFILRWEDEFDEREHYCRYKNTDNPPVFEKKYKKRRYEDMADIWGHRNDWPGGADWNPYWMMPTVYYYGYKGSPTVPPCGKNVYWRFLDLPQQISVEQHQRLHRILLDQKDEKCRNSSKAYNGGVNRPIQNNRDERVEHCTGKFWRPRFEFTFCDKWPKDYHGAFRLRGICPGYEDSKKH